VKHYRISVFLILSILIITGSFACRRHKEFQGYDGTWWNVTPLDQQLGFIEGFLECYTYGLREGEKLRRPRSWYQTAISSYYREYGDSSMTVGRVLIQAAEKSPFTKSEFSNQAIKREAWLTYSEKKRLGFVEGYLNALMPRDSRAAVFRKNPEHYAKAITRQCSDPTGSQKTIAEILWDMRNKGNRNVN
jgi:hypothetical protein